VRAVTKVGGVAATLDGGLMSIGVPHNQVRIRPLVIGFVADEIRRVQGGGWPSGGWRCDKAAGRRLSRGRREGGEQCRRGRSDT
jgi:hypothetical protein